MEKTYTSEEHPLKYSHEQGLADRELKIDEIFHPSTLELTEDGR